jgi:hypothetical protein
LTIKKELDDAIIKFGSGAIAVVVDDFKINKKIFDNYGDILKYPESRLRRDCSKRKTPTATLELRNIIYLS